MKDFGIAFGFLLVLAIIYHLFSSAFSGSSTEARILVVLLVAIIGGLFNAYAHKGVLSASEKLDVEKGKITKEEALAKPGRENHFLVGAFFAGIFALVYAFQG
jgi:uncharacterized membrane protein YedE/YeeE